MSRTDTAITIGASLENIVNITQIYQNNFPETFIWLFKKPHHTTTYRSILYKLYSFLKEQCTAETGLCIHFHTKLGETFY